MVIPAGGPWPSAGSKLIVPSSTGFPPNVTVPVTVEGPPQPAAANVSTAAAVKEVNLERFIVGIILFWISTAPAMEGYR
jgi:hypothetical protein